MKINFSALQQIYYLSCSLVLYSQHSTFSDDSTSKNAQKEYSYLSVKKWQPTVTFGGKYGNQRRIGQLALLSPLLQNDTSLLYLDFRFMADSRSAKEGNFGIGKRWFTDNQKFIFGIYSFYDRRRTELSNIVNQITLGFEAISNTWDYRANFYYPQNTIKEVEKSRKIIDTKSWREFVGNNEYIMTQNSIKTLKIQEVPLKGLDLEIGSVVPGVKSLRLYGAYYYFQGRAKAKSINGFRIRSNFQLNDNFSVLLEGSRDNVRKTSGFVGFQFRVELGEKRKKTNGLTSLEKRMVELPERDIDIVTNESALTTGISSSLTKELKSTNNYFIKIKKKGNSGNHFIKIKKKSSSGKAPRTTYGLYENPYNLKQKNQLNPLKNKLQEKKERVSGLL